jgi:hypothetical protein
MNIINKFKYAKLIKEFSDKTECTKEQAETIIPDILAINGFKELVWEHLDEMELLSCEKLEVVRCWGHSKDYVNICCRRPNRPSGLDILYKYCFCIPEKRMTYEII